jgi:predicted transcriptional regulator
MFAKSLIDETILPAKTSDSATLALTWMDEHKISHYPIANNGNYLGLISEDDIYLCEAFDDL